MKACELINLAAQVVYDKKGFNILALDVRKVCSMTDYFLIAEGNVNQHVKSLATAVIHALKVEGEAPIHTEGRGEGRWIVLDYGYAFLHFFVPELRNYYRLEELWSEGKIIDLNINP